MIVQVHFQPWGKQVCCPRGVSLLEASRRAGANLQAPCSGRRLCGRCKVKIIHGEVSPPTDVEKAFLSLKELERGFRLACLVGVDNDLSVEIPPESHLALKRLQTAGLEIKTIVDPAVRVYSIELSAPSLDDSHSDLERLSDQLAHIHGHETERTDLAVVRQLPAILRQADWKIRAAVRDDEIVAVFPEPSVNTNLGVAIDLGTTKIAAYLVDLETGEVLGARGLPNPQSSFGADIMSRLSFGLRSSENESALQKTVLEGLNGLIEGLSRERGAKADEIVEVVVVGNTVMHHLFLGLPLRQLALAPYVAALSAPVEVKARDLGLRVAAGAYVHVLPVVGGFVGADTVAVILATGLHEGSGVRLALDIGTNTEVVLSRGGQLTSCSCPCGPVFEGAGIAAGTLAVSGAIEKVEIGVDEKVRWWSVDHQKPIGLCGSGILDAVAQMYRAGITDEKGRIGAVRRGCRRNEQGEPEFVLVPAEESGTALDITITQGDIRKVQMAKGAIRAGINILLKDAGVAPEDLQEVIIAGAFGSYITVEHAVAVGLLPDIPLERFHQVGNAAGTGARLALVSKAQRSVARDVARATERIELAVHPQFSAEYVGSMYYPSGASPSN